jgi:hypothetical protein
LGPGPVWTGTEKLSPTGIRSPKSPARIESIYRLRYANLPYLHSDIRKTAISGNPYTLEMSDKTIFTVFPFYRPVLSPFVNYNLLNRSVILEIISVVDLYVYCGVLCPDSMLSCE